MKAHLAKGLEEAGVEIEQVGSTWVATYGERHARGKSSREALEVLSWDLAEQAGRMLRAQSAALFAVVEGDQ